MDMTQLCQCRQCNAERQLVYNLPNRVALVPMSYRPALVGTNGNNAAQVIATLVRKQKTRRGRVVGLGGG